MYDRQDILHGMNDNHKHNTQSHPHFIPLARSDDLLESTVDGRPGGGILPEVDRRHRALRDALGRELELLQGLLVNPLADTGEVGA